MKKPDKPEHMNGDHDHLRQMIEWHRDETQRESARNRDETRREFGRVYWLFGGVFLVGLAILTMVASLLVQL